MHSDEKGGLRGKFEGFEFEPGQEVWDRIAEQAPEAAKPGALGSVFDGFSYAPQAAVWERILAGLYPQRRSRGMAYFWLATAAGVALLFGAYVSFFSPQLRKDTPAASGYARSNDPGVDAHDGDTSQQFAGQPAGPDHSIRTDCEQDPPQQSPADPQRQLAMPSQDTPKAPGQRRLPLQPPVQYAGHIPGDQPAGTHQGDSPDRLKDKRTQRPAMALHRGIEPVFISLVQPGGEAPHTLPHPLDLNTEMEADDNTVEKRPKRQDRWITPDEDSPERYTYAALGSNLGPSGSGLGRSEAAGPDLAASPFTQDQNFAESLSKENYSTPITLGMNLFRNLGGRWSLGGGLAYTLLKSEIDYTNYGWETHEAIRRQYLGLQGGLQYQVYNRRRFRVFLSSGVQYDFGLEGQTTSTDRQDGQVVGTTRYTQQLGDQASLQGGIGTSYLLGSKISLYALANASHYFYQSHRNLWSERVVWPTLQAGLRIDL